MKKIRRYGAIFIALLVFLLFSNLRQKDEAIQNRHWRLVRIADKGMEGTGLTAILTFDAKKNIFSLSAFCNQINGRYSIHARRRTIQFKDFASTWKSCKDIETEYLLTDVLKNTSHYYACGDTLFFYHNSEKRLVFYSK